MKEQRKKKKVKEKRKTKHTKNTLESALHKRFFLFVCLFCFVLFCFFISHLTLVLLRVFSQTYFPKGVVATPLGLSILKII